MYLKDRDYPTATLQEFIIEPPVSKGAIAFFGEIYKVSRSFLDAAIFAQIRYRIEQAIGHELNLRKRLDKATFGRFITWGELSHRQALPHGWQPLNLLMEDEPTIEQLNIPFEDMTTTETDSRQESEHGNSDFTQLKEERDRANDRANRYKQQLEQFERFTQLLLVGRIFAEPPSLNGMQDTPLLRAFGSPTTLDQLNANFRILRAKHHPDSSPYNPHSAPQLSHRPFPWLK